MSSMNYRTKDGRADYRFSIERQPDGSYRAYIRSQPSYRGRCEHPACTHRSRDDWGRRYVCWTRKLWSEADAHKVASMWADCTQEYIRTGWGF
jgi:hypothetical protein